MLGQLGSYCRGHFAISDWLLPAFAMDWLRQFDSQTLMISGKVIISQPPENMLRKLKRTITATSEALEAGLTQMISRYENGTISVIDISVITTFSWDRLYFFGDYTDPEDLDTEIGKSWRNTCSREASRIESSDSYTLLVFTNNNIVVHCFVHPKGIHPFDLLPQQYGKPGFSPQEALFVLGKDGWLASTDNK